MQAFPHRYLGSATAGPGGDVIVRAPGLTDLRTASPAEFGGRGDRWSPETLLVGAVADCFVLTFRAVAAAARLSWEEVACEVDGTLDRVDRALRFTHLTVRVRLQVPDGVDAQAAHRAIERAESGCLITRSLNADVRLEADVRVAAPAMAGG